MKLSDAIDALIVGSTFFGTGGGGSPREAVELYRATVEHRDALVLLAPSDLKEDEIVVSAFSVGMANVPGDPQQPLQKGLHHLSNAVGRRIAGIVPVEIGPKALATAFRMAAYMDLPVIDADIVGGRSSPEVFIETITLFDIPRVPSFVANNQGDSALLLESSGPHAEERFFRAFSELSGGQAHVLGYALTGDQIRRSVEGGTVSRTIEIGKLLDQGNSQRAFDQIGGRVLLEGVISEVVEDTSTSFLQRNIWIRASNGRVARIFVRNEFLLCWIDDRPVLTCPDLIAVVNSENLPIYGADLEQGMEVKIIGVPGTPLWRSPEGRKLFSPRTFGFDFEPVLLGEIPFANDF